MPPGVQRNRRSDQAHPVRRPDRQDLFIEVIGRVVQRGALAIADLDVIRKRAGLSLVADINPGIAKDALLQMIYKERMTELFGEQGHRWFDVKRTGQADTLYSIRKTRWRKEAILLPIPLGDRQKNPNLTQNEGYE